MKKWIFTFCSFAVLFSDACAGEKQQIRLWGDEVPGFAEYKQPEQVREGIIRKVSDPFLTITPAAKEVRTGQGLIIFPGGGYAGLADGHEGEDVAEYYAAKGVTCFVVRYRVNGGGLDAAYRFPFPLIDARQSIRIAKKMAPENGIDPEKIGVLGFSAGGHLASMCLTMFNDDFEQEPKSDVSVRPAFGALIYPVASMQAVSAHAGSRMNLLGIKDIKNVTEEEKHLLEEVSPELRVKKGCPPLFIAHNQFDRVDAKLSLVLADAYTRAEVPCELHFFPAKPHGFGMGKEGETEQSNPGVMWPELLSKFLNRQ